MITDVSPYRLELARSMGVDLALDVSRESIAEAQARLGMVEGFDVALEMSGHPSALPEVIANLNHGGRIAMLGLPSTPIDIDWGKVVTHMITIKGIYGREMFETWYAMSAMLRSGPGHLVRRHPSLPRHVVARGVRDGARRPVRQGRHGLERVMYGTVREQLQSTLDEIRSAGLYKAERQLASPQSAHVSAGGRDVLNFCANNYLGLADHPSVVAAAKAALDEWGFGMASRAFHLRHADAAHRTRGAAVGVPRHRGDDPVLVVLRRQRRRCSRCCWTRTTR